MDQKSMFPLLTHQTFLHSIKEPLPQPHDHICHLILPKIVFPQSRIACVPVVILSLFHVCLFLANAKLNKDIYNLEILISISNVFEDEIGEGHGG